MSEKKYIPIFGAWGMVVGLVLGMLTDSIPVGVGAGLAIGVGVGAVRQQVLRHRAERR